MATESNTDRPRSDRPPGRLRTLLLSAGALCLCFRVTTVVLNLVTTVLLARALSPSGFGLFAVAYAMVGFGVVVSTVGLEHALVRRVAAGIEYRGSAGVRDSITAACVLVLVGCVITSGAVLLGRNVWFGGALAGVSWIIAAWVGFQSFATVQMASLRGLHRLIAAGACQGFIRGLVMLAIVVALAVTGRITLPAALGAGAAAAALRLLVGQVLLIKRLPPAREHEAASLIGAVGKLWRDAWPFMISSSLSFLTTRADVWLVAIFVHAEHTGVYAAAARLVLPVGLPLAALNATMSSTITRLHTRRRMRVLEKVCRQGATLAAAPTALMVAVLLIGGGRLLGVLFGPAYARAGAVLAVLALAHLLRTWTGSCGQVLIMTGHSKQQLLVNILSGGVLLGGSALAAPVWGMLGVAVAVASATVVNNLVMILLARRTTGIWTHAPLNPVWFGKNLSATAALLIYTGSGSGVSASDADGKSC